MSLRSDQREDGESTSSSSEAKTDRYGFLLVNGDTNNDSDDPCPELVRHREMKWINLICQWDQVLEKKHSKIKAQCQKGIPASVRSKCWPLLCGATQRKQNNKDLYKSLESSPGQQSWIDVIKRDTDRQFPFHEMFQSEDSPGQQGLLQVLKAYTQFRPDEGYCQAQGPVAAVLLMHMPMEEAFWCLVQISELYLPGYYSPLLEGVLFDAAILFGVLKRTCPAAYKHMQKQEVEPLMFATDWLMCLYTRHLPFNTLLRVWDLFFCNGVRVLFQVAVILVRRCLGEARQRKECEGQMETLERLRSVRGRIQQEQADAFIQEVCSVPLSLAELQRQTEKELEKWRKEHPSSTFDPRNRCHGYYTIWEKGKEREMENERKERLSGNLRAPVMRSHSSLSPAILRKKWRKRGCETETEEWEGKAFTKKDSDEDERRRASVCGVSGELRAKTEKTPQEFSTHLQKEHNTTTNTQRTSATEIERVTDSNDIVFKEDEDDMVVIAVSSHTDEEETKPSASLREADPQTANIRQEKQHNPETHGDEEKKEQTSRDDQDGDILTLQNQPEAQTREEESQFSQREEARKKLEEEKQENKSRQEEETEMKTWKPEEDVQLNTNTQEEEVNIIQQEVEVEVNSDINKKQEHGNEIDSEPEEEMEIDSSKQEKEIHLGSSKEEAINTCDVQEKEIKAKSNEIQEGKGSGNYKQRVEWEEEQEKKANRSEQEVKIHDAEEVIEYIEIQEVNELKANSVEQEVNQDEKANIGEQETENQEEKEIKAHNIEQETEKKEEKEIKAHNIEQEVENQEEKEIKAHNIEQEVENQEEKEIKAHNIEQEVENQEEKEIKAHNIEQEVENQEEKKIKAHNIEQEVENQEEKEIKAHNIEQEVENQEEKEIMAHNSEQEVENQEEKEIKAHNSEQEVENQEEKEIKAHNSEQEVENQEEKEIKAHNSEQEMENQEEKEIKAHNSEQEVEIEDGDKQANSVTEEEKLQLCLMHTQDVPTDGQQQQEASEQKTGVEPTLKTEEEMHSNVLQTPDQKDAEERAHFVQEEDQVKDDCYDCGNNTDVEKTPQEQESEKEKEAPICDAPEKETEETITDEEIRSSDNLTVDQEASETVEQSGDSETPQDSNKTQDENMEGNNISKPEHKEPERTSECRNPESPQPDEKEEEAELEINIATESNLVKSPFGANQHPQLCLRRSSSSYTSYPTILSEDTFKDPQQSNKRDLYPRTTEAEGSDIVQPKPTQLQSSKMKDPQKPQQKSDKPKLRGLFQLLRADTPSKSIIPKIVIQDFSEGEEKLSSKERRHRRRMQERNEKEEEKEKKKLLKELEKEKTRERKKPQTRGKSFQMLNRKHDNDDVFSGRSASKAAGRKRTSYSESYF